jgi:hypothetical protein
MPQSSTRTERLEGALKKAAKCKLPSIAKKHGDHPVAIDARAELGLRVVKQIDAVLGLLRTRPARGGLEGRLDHSRVSRPVGTREIATASMHGDDASVALWDRLAGISTSAWRDLHAAEADEAKAARTIESRAAGVDGGNFRALYMGILTDGLAGELDQMREDEQLSRAGVEMLVNALETGADAFLPFERALVVHSFAQRS